MDHVDAFNALPFADELVDLGLFPYRFRAKEISESYAMLAAIQAHVLNHLPAQTEGYPTIFVVGDGATPRTAALLAKNFPSSNVFSVDPLLPPPPSPPSADSIPPNFPSIPNLTTYSGRVQAVLLKATSVLIVLMHAHVSLPDVLSSILSSPSLTSLSCVACPCCNFGPRQATLFGKPPDSQYEDEHIIGGASAKRQVRCWVNVAPSHGELRANTDAVLRDHASTFRQPKEDGPLFELDARGRQWSTQETSEDGLRVAADFFARFPKLTGASAVGDERAPEDWEGACGAAEPGTNKLRDCAAAGLELASFTGRVGEGRLEKLGKRVVLFDLALPNGAVVHVKANEDLFAGAAVNSTQMRWLLKNFGGVGVRVVGYPFRARGRGAGGVGGEPTLLASGVEILLEEPDEASIRERYRQRRTDMGLCKADPGWWWER
ncbi:hypothetical protein TeGR_g5189 [Tetraparma gracilis]|uniref:Uncharacterized protein n=1 Tax=Tetraparma gracilis TaxID=2962635 RepID=A0ABQ6MGB7_9STRA|nr:hypothetical protein TeGR_g5189 [Tetraparma gracilis]